jgi:hypothetical protein
VSGEAGGRAILRAGSSGRDHRAAILDARAVHAVHAVIAKSARAEGVALTPQRSGR